MSNSRLASIFNSLREAPSPVDEEMKRPARPAIDKTPLGREQRRLFDIMEGTTKSLFVTGKAGTGKSYLLNFFIKNTEKDVVVLAPTGVAAINVGGQTIHSFFRLPPETPIPESKLVPSNTQAQTYRSLDAIVIDEASMIGADIMDAIDRILRKATGSRLPFGGKQLLLFGDLYQLPPVANSQVKRYLDDAFGGSFFFNAPGIKECDLDVHELRHVFRQKDPAFIKILNEVREGTVTDENLARLNERANVSAEDDIAVIIAPTRDAVERINQSTLEGISEPEFTYEAIVEGDMREKEFPAPKLLKLKVGARVMMLKNDQGTTSDRPEENRRWVNGTLGQISRLTEDQIWVMINGVSHQIDRAVWPKRQYAYDHTKKKLDSRITAEFRQFPVRLAWAVTVHKAQGATYQSVGIDMEDGMFAAGQTYVALSRCVDMGRLYLNRPITQRDILTSSEAKAFLKKHLAIDSIEKEEAENEL